MPIYEYHCESCNLIQERLVLSSSEDADQVTCEECGGPAKKVPSVPRFYLSPGGAGGFSHPGMSGINYEGAMHLDEPDRPPAGGVPGGKPVNWKARHRRSLARRARIKAEGREAAEQLKAARFREM